jgi:amino acid adenylation domain-containing protein
VETDAIETSASGVPSSVEEPSVLSFPASLAQQAFWFLEQLDPGSTAFNVAVRFHLAGPLDVAILERAFNEVIRRHETLRTRFEEESDELMQVVLPSIALKLDVLDLSELPETERKIEMERQGSIEAQKRFSLNQAPLIRANLLRLAPEEHILQVTIHHAVCDGWSIGILTDEIAALYEAFAKGEPSPLPELPIQFADFTIWQHEFLKGPEIAAQLEYWQKRLANYVELDLPTDRHRPEVKQWQGDIVSILLPQELTDKLQAIAQQNGATLFMVFVAAFKILLLRFTGQEQIAIGSPVVGRTRVEIEKLIGVFINTVILHTDFAGNPPFDEALRAVRDTVVEAMANQDLPFEHLVKELQPARDLSRNPLFQINFIHQRDFVKPVKFGGISLTAVPSRSPGAIFDLQFFMVERFGVWRASCEYNTALYSRETTVRMLGYFKQLLASIAADPQTPIRKLEILPPEVRKQLLVDWNDTKRDYPADKTIHELFQEQVAANPSKVAVRCGKRSMTYTELDEMALRVCGQLQAAGAKPGVMVGLCVERSAEMLAGILGILKSGAAYVPMDPAFPAQRLTYMIEDARMPVIVTQSRVSSSLPPHQAKIVLLEECLSSPPAAKTRNASSNDLAYVIFTSGSTGRPKGVQIPHRTVVNFLNSMRREPGLTRDDILLSVTTLSFDIAGLELFLPLTTGATVVVAPREVVTDAALLIEELDRTKATMLQATPITWRMLLEAGWKGSPQLKALIGGEAVPRELVNKLAPLCRSLWNMYGPTETTIWSSVGRLEAGEGPVKIGGPIDNTQIYIVSRDEMQLQPIGVAGELLIGGDGLALGYLNRPELTAEKFISDPFSGRAGARLYRTGDLARWHADGTLECLQRMDDQVKIRGYRIELGEVESAIARHPDVRQAVVVAREDVAGGKRLVGYIVPAEGRIPNSAGLREHVRANLPDYMTPSAFVVLDKLPLTPNGKIDRKALPALDSESVAPSACDEKPRNETEERLAAIFSKTLRTTVSSIHDNFFELGGHSLLAVSLMSSIEREFGLRIPLARLLGAPTVARLAEHIRAPASVKPQWHALAPIRPAEGKPRFYLVHGAGGNILLYRELAQALGPEISIYGFQSLGLDHETKPLERIEEMAARYVDELRAFQPSGPYHIGGYCMGGAVAYEMARLLSKAGQKVGLVALLDSYNQSSIKRETGCWSALSTARQKARFHISNLGKLNSKQLRGYINEKRRLVFELVSNFIARRRKGGVDHDTGKAVVARIHYLNHEAAWHFTPQPTEAAVTVFRPKYNYSYFSDPSLGWSSVARSRFEVIQVGDNPHAMLIQPQVEMLACELRKRILRTA